MKEISHVAIIMDGNGRWGLKRHKTRNFGHQRGIKTVEEIIDASIKKKIKYLTLYTFSTENWKRPKNEINFLFKLLSKYLNKNLNVLIKNSWISPTKIRLIKVRFEKATLYCDENESLYKIKIYKKGDKKDWTDYSLDVPEIDLTEPLAKMTTYIYNSIKRNKNNLFSKL